MSCVIAAVQYNQSLDQARAALEVTNSVVSSGRLSSRFGKRLRSVSPNSSVERRVERKEMVRTRSSTSLETPNPIPKSKRRRLERGEHSRDGKGKREERSEEGATFDEVASVIDSADDVLLAEELEIQEILFTSMQSCKEKEGEGFSLQNEDDQGSDKSKHEHNDRKGKRPAKSTFSNSESGQSSKVIRKNVCCKICMERVPAMRTFSIKPCNHIFCNSCIANYITSKLDENIATIICPNPSCSSGSLDPLTCQHIVPADIFDKWGRVLCESSLGQSKFYCPFKDCSALLVDGGEEVKNCECPHCHRMFCAQCRVPWHADVSCQEFQRLGKDERGQADLMLKKLAKDKRWQRCPQCRMYVEKIDGCMFMKCRCGYCFCYVCATPMSKETHYCPTCRR